MTLDEIESSLAAHGAVLNGLWQTDRRNPGLLPDTAAYLHRHGEWACNIGPRLLDKTRRHTRHSVCGSGPTLQSAFDDAMSKWYLPEPPRGHAKLVPTKAAVKDGASLLQLLGLK